MRENLFMKAVFLLMLSFNAAKTISHPFSYTRQIDLYLHKIRGKNFSPQNLHYHRNGKQNFPALLTPLVMQYFTYGDETEVSTSSPFTGSSSTPIRQYQYMMNDNSDISSTNSSKDGEDSSQYPTGDINEPPFLMPVSSYPPTKSNDSSAVELLPTIATPFFDSLTHAIVGEIQQHVQLIKPGTKWCGDGNKARSYEDVGVLYKTDKCCRTHDKCPYYILAHETKYELKNEAHFTRSHCDCDASFYDCLKKVNSPFSTSVGITYFNLLKMKCFRLEYPVVMCSNTAGWFSKHCVEYVVDMRKQKQWQWFDNHEF